jgi:hypothetical protein
MKGYKVFKIAKIPVVLHAIVFMVNVESLFKPVIAKRAHPSLLFIDGFSQFLPFRTVPYFAFYPACFHP